MGVPMMTTSKMIHRVMKFAICVMLSDVCEGMQFVECTRAGKGLKIRFNVFKGFSGSILQEGIID